MSFAKKFGNKYGKKLLNKRISASKRITNVENFLPNSATRLNESKYGKVLKKEAGKQLSDKIIFAAVDLSGSKIADKITSLKILDKKEPQEETESEEQEIIIPPHQRQKIINDLKFFKYNHGISKS